MPIDPYTPCPGGTGKKIKFCCSDLVNELDKVQRMLEGDQRAACLEYIDGLQPKYPDRACLLSMKAMLEAQLGQETQAEATLERFMEKYPKNPVALAERASFLASKEGGLSGIAPLQDALEQCQDQIPPPVYDAIGIVAQNLVADNHLIPGRAHLILQLGISGTQDQNPLQLLIRLNGSPSVPLLAKQDLPLMPAPDDALWKSSFTKALEPAMHGAWRKSADDLTALAAKVGDWPAIWHNVAVLRTWLGDVPSAIAAWRKYAAADIPLDDAVEAETLAQSLDVDAYDQIDVLTLEYGVNDVEALQARLMANPRAQQIPIDLARMGSENEPPPKGAWWLLDRPLAASGAELTLADVSRVVGQAFLYGKQTDRPARVELVSYRTELAEAQTSLSEIAGDALGTLGKEEVTTHVPAVQHLLASNWQLPPDTPLDRRLSLVDQKRRAAILERWPEMKQKLFGDRSPREAVSDPAERKRLLAAILLVELAASPAMPSFDFNALRTTLGLPSQEPLDPSQVPLAELSLLRLARVDVKKLSDEQLVDLYKRADHYRHIVALRKLAEEVIARPSLDKLLNKAEVYGLLAQLEPDTHKSVALLDEARKVAEASKTSTAPWDLAELAMRIAGGEVAEADRLLNHIRQEHIREQGVAQALFQILSDAGIIGPDGRPTAAAAAAAQDPAGIVVPGAAAEPGKIWTPGSDQPTGKKSALWTPGD